MKKILICIVLVLHIFFTGNIGIFLNTISQANAEVGDIGHWRDSVGGQIPGTTFAGFDFNQQIRNDGIYTKPTNNTIQLSEAGDYLVIATIRGVDNSNGRYNAQARVALTAGTGNVFSSYYTGFSRDNSEDTAWFRAVGVVMNASANAQVQVQRRRDTDTPTSGSVANQSDVQVIRISQSNYGLYAIGGTGNAYGGTTPNAIDITSVISQTNTAAIEGNTSTETVTVKGNNKKYLVAWSASFDTGGPRTQRIGHLEYDGTDKLSTRSYCYQRSNSTEYCGIGSMDVIQTGTPDIAIKAEAFRGPGVGADQGGASVDGNAVTDGNGQMIVLEMPDYLETFRSEDSVGLQDITTAQTLNIARDVNFNSPLSFTKNSNSLVSVTNPADIFSWANIWTARNNVTSGSRLTSYGSITIGGVKQTVGEHGNYSRGNQASQSTFAMGFQPAGIFTTSGAGTTLGVSTDPLAGTSGGGTDRTQPGTVGFFALNLDTLIAPALNQSNYRLFTNTNSTNVGTPLAAQNTPATLSSDGEAFRLRSLMSITQNKLRQNEKNFKLQFAVKSGTCDIAFAGETYTDVTATSAIAFNNNATPADDVALTANVNDPTNGGTSINQSYQELNNFTPSVSAIPRNQNGKWDFSLRDNTAPDNTSYCFRMVESNGSLLNSYTIIPEITTNNSLSCGLNDVDIVFETDNFGEDTYWSLVPSGNACGVGELDNGGNTNLTCASGGARNAIATDGYADSSIITEGPFSLTVGADYTLHVIDNYGDGMTVGAGGTDPDIRINQNGAETDNFSVTGNGGVFSFTIDGPTGCVDTVKPNVTVNQGPTQTDPSTNGSATFRVVFNEPINVATFIGGDISLTGTSGSINSGPSEITPNNGTTFEFTVSGMVPADTVTATIPAGGIEDISGNTNNISTSTDNSVTYTPIVTPGPGGVGTGLNLWLKSNIGTSTTTNNANLATWNDQSGNGKNATAVTAPTYRNNTTDNVNFYPVVNFNGTTQSMVNTTGGMSSKNYFAVVIPTNTTDGTLGGGVPYGLECTNATVSTGTCGLPFGGVVLGAFTAAIPDEVITHAIGASTGYRSADTGTSSYEAGKPMLITINENAVGNGTDIYEKGVAVNNFAANTYQSLTGANYSIGASRDPANLRYFNGKVAEVINFNNRLSDTDRWKVESYLSLKYGITLKNGTQNYLASDGTTIMWNATTAGVYKNGIFGVGRDTVQSLGQVQAKSINSDAVVSLIALGEGTNITPAFVDIANKEFLTISNDNLGNTWTSTSAPATYNILSRKWKVQEVGDVGTISLTFDVANPNFDIPNPSLGTNYYFVRDTNSNGSLSDETPALMTNLGGNQWQISGINPSGGQIFTIASQASSNNIPTNITLSNNSVNENVAANTTIGTLSTTDADALDTHTYSLVTGTGDDQNNFFTLSGNTLRLVHSPDFEIRNSYSIRLQTNDGNGGIYQKQFTISINNLAETTTSFLDFENNLNNYKYTVTSGNWSPTATNPFAGTRSMQSNNLGVASTQSCFEVSHTSTGTGTIDFQYNVSSQAGGDFLRYYMDNVEQGTGWSGTIPWTKYTSGSIASGTHTYKWCYIKDATTNTGTDNAFIDNITFTNTAVDTTPPNITSLNFASGSLLPGGNHDIIINYSDLQSGINTASANMIVNKWNGTTWGTDISGTSLTGAIVNTSSAKYSTNNLLFGKYRYIFQISDNVGNISTSTGAVFYIDEPEINISDPVVEIGSVNSISQNFSSTVTITVKTLGAGYNLIMNAGSNLVYSTQSLIPWDGTRGFGYQQVPYNGTINAIGTNQNIATQAANINTNGQKNTYTYEIQLGAQSDLNTAAGGYEGSLDFNIQLQY